MTRTLPPALIVAHGQPSRPAPPETALADLARTVGARLPDRPVLSATLAAPGALETALQACDQPPVVYPMFMADGWFVRQQLPKRLGDFGGRILPPLGLDPALPALAAEALRQHAHTRGWRIKDTTVLLAAHGSARGPRAAQAAQAFVRALAPLLPLHHITAGFVEETPTIEQAAKGLGTRALCLPFFALGGDHVTQDIPQGLAAANFKGDLLSPLGQLPQVPALIAEAIRRTNPC